MSSNNEPIILPPGNYQLDGSIKITATNERGFAEDYYFRFEKDGALDLKVLGRPFSITSLHRTGGDRE